MCLNVLKTCSNVLFLAVLSGYGWLFGGDGCFLVVTSDYEYIWGEYVCFLGLQVAFLGGLLVAKLGFGRLKVVIGGYEWLSGVCVWVLPWKCNPDNKSSLQNVSSWQNVHPDKMSILTKHTFLTKCLLTFSQHKSWALKHGRKSVIQINHASGTPICLVNIISVYFQKNTGFKSN